MTKRYRTKIPVYRSSSDHSFISPYYHHWAWNIKVRPVYLYLDLSLPFSPSRIKKKTINGGIGKVNKLVWITDFDQEIKMSLMTAIVRKRQGNISIFIFYICLFLFDISFYFWIDFLLFNYMKRKTFFFILIKTLF